MSTRLLFSTIAIVFLQLSVFVVAAPAAEEEAEPAEVQQQAREVFEALKVSGPRFRLSGEVKSGKNTRYSINGEDFTVASDALILGAINIGSSATVRGQIVSGKKIARKVVVASNSGVADASSVDIESEVTGDEM